MIPILYDSTRVEFGSFGLGLLKDTIECTVNEERNSVYELSMQYPITGILFDSFTNGQIISAIPNNTSKRQPFRIYNISKSYNGVVDISAEHVINDTNGVTIMPFTAENIQDAFKGLAANAVGYCPFTFWTDKTTVAHFEVKEPTNLRELLNGSEGSILDVFGGGDYEFDCFEIKLYQNRGKENSATIAYGKNITDLSLDDNADDVITGIVPFYLKEDTDENENTTVESVYLPEVILYHDKDVFPPICPPHDFTSEFEEKPSIEQLRSVAQSYLNTTTTTKPKINLKVSFIPLWQTQLFYEDYFYNTGLSLEDLKKLENVNMCDTITVDSKNIDILMTAKIIKYSFDVLSERCTSVEIGEPKQKVSNILMQQETVIQSAKVVANNINEKITQINNKPQTPTTGNVLLVPPNTPKNLYAMDETSVNASDKLLCLGTTGLSYYPNGVKNKEDILIDLKTGQVDLIGKFQTIPTLINSKNLNIVVTDVGILIKQDSTIVASFKFNKTTSKTELNIDTVNAKDVVLTNLNGKKIKWVSDSAGSYVLKGE